MGTAISSSVPEWDGLPAPVSALAQRSRRIPPGGDVGLDIDTLHAVAGQILQVCDLDQALRSINECTVGLLEADICGVFLRDRDELVMRGCVGNHMAETSRLRMRRGQGLAGLVFSTGTAGRVDNYLTDPVISQDFTVLAASERALSALAVPLRAPDGGLTGVLEVWRRRASVFTDQDVRRLEALAALSAIAIENSRLHTSHAEALQQLRTAHQELQDQLSAFDRSNSLQRALLAAVLDGLGQTGVVRTLARELGGTAVVLGVDLQPVALYPPDADPSAAVELLARGVGRTPRRGTVSASPAIRPGVGIRLVRTHPIVLDGDIHGHVGLIVGGCDEALADVAIGQATMACCLVVVQQQAASRARTQAYQEVLWDLVEGSSEQRVAARSRAESMGVSLRGRFRVLHAAVENMTDLARLEQWDAATADRTRRGVLRLVREVASRAEVPLLSVRGDWLIGITSSCDPEQVRVLVQHLATTVHARYPRLELRWGVSSAGHGVLQLPAALREARTAVGAARRMGVDHPCLYDELGIVRLLMADDDEPDLQVFMAGVTQPLIEYDRQHDGALLGTLRAFFEADCSQRVAAHRLSIHHKTLRYRLDQIKQLTGLDLSRHEDRMRADLAIRLHDVAVHSAG